MKKLFALLIVFNALLLASGNENSEAERKSRIDKQIEIEMEKEKKYSREQMFYSGENYDLKGAEVNQDSLLSVPVLEPQDDFDMDSVYD